MADATEKCPVCGEEFKRLKQHLALKHPEYQPPQEPVASQDAEPEPEPVEPFEIQGGDMFTNQEGETIVFLGDLRNGEAKYVKHANATAITGATYADLQRVARIMKQHIIDHNINSGIFTYVGNIADSWG